MKSGRPIGRHEINETFKLSYNDHNIIQKDAKNKQQLKMEFHYSLKSSIVWTNGMLGYDKTNNFTNYKVFLHNICYNLTITNKGDINGC